MYNSSITTLTTLTNIRSQWNKFDRTVWIACIYLLIWFTMKYYMVKHKSNDVSCVPRVSVGLVSSTLYYACCKHNVVNAILSLFLCIVIKSSATTAGYLLQYLISFLLIIFPKTLKNKISYLVHVVFFISLFSILFELFNLPIEIDPQTSTLSR